MVTVRTAPIHNLDAYVQYNCVAITPVTVRAATLDDAETIAGHRRSMFFDMGHRDEEQLNAMISAFRPWLRQKMAVGEYLAWMAADGEGTIVAGLGLWLMDWPPHMVGPGSRRGNILNVYTAPKSPTSGNRPASDGSRARLVP